MRLRPAGYYLRARRRFENERYLLVRELMPRDLVRYLQAYYEVLLNNDMFVKDDQCPLSLSLGGDPGFDSLLEFFRPEISRLVGLAVAPTYSYTRQYAKGDKLKRHRDRDACEISVTISVRVPERADPSTLYLKLPGGKPLKVEMREGDGCVYAGTQVEHWREAFPVGGYLQLFLHFVDSNGPHYPRWRYDGRKYLGAEYPRKRS